MSYISFFGGFVLKRGLLYVGLVLLFAGALVARPVSALPKDSGNTDFIAYEIVYMEAYGWTIVDEAGIHYNWNNTPWGCWSGSFSEAKYYPEEYYGEYDLYFCFSWLVYEVHLENTGSREISNMEVTAIQEYFQADGSDGEDFPGESTDTWFVDSLAPGESLTLYGTYFIPLVESSGLDQTHLILDYDIILPAHDNRGHGNNADHDDEDNPGNGGGGHGAEPGYDDDGYDDDELKGFGKNRGTEHVTIDDPQAGIFCPPLDTPKAMSTVFNSSIVWLFCLGFVGNVHFLLSAESPTLRGIVKFL